MRTLFAFTIFIFVKSSSALNTDLDVPENQKTAHYPVCVIGAGFSGLSAAATLKDKGYDVIVIANTDRVGGKVKTFRVSDKIQVDMCPVIFTAWHTSVFKYVQKFSLTPVQYNISDVVQFDTMSGFLYPPPTLTLAQKAEIFDAILRYKLYRLFYTKDLEFEYLNTSPDLFVPILEWLKIRRLTSLTPIFISLITVEGYGALNDTPAIYVLKFVDEKLLMAMATQTDSVFFTLKEGFDVLVNKMATPFKIILNKYISSVVPEKNHQMIHFHGNQQLPQKCHKVILAFPPLLSNVMKIMDLTDEEINVLKHVRINLYTSAANHIPSIEHTLYIEGITPAKLNDQPNLMFPQGIGEVIGLLKQSSKEMGNIYSSYSWIQGDFNRTANHEELNKIDANLNVFLKKIHKDAKTYYRKTSDYFPHVGTSALQNAFYKNFSRLQGQRGIYFCTTLLSFEDMDCAIKNAENLVNKYFGGK